MSRRLSVYTTRSVCQLLHYLLLLLLYRLTYPLVEEAEPHWQDDGKQQQYGDDSGAERMRLVDEEGIAGVHDLTTHTDTDTTSGKVAEQNTLN